MSVIARKVRSMTVTDSGFGADAASRAPLGRRVLSVAGTVAVVLIVGFVNLAFVAYSAGEISAARPVVTLWAMTCMAAAVAGGVALVWRARHAVPILLATAASAFVFSIGPAGVLGVLPWVIARASRQTLGWAIPLSAAVVAGTLVLDASREPARSVFSARDPSTGLATHASPVTYVAIGAVLLGLSVLAGFLRRSRAEAVVAHGSARAATRRAVELRDELTRQEERQHIAREMHDTVAHHLSLLSLHAAALEVTSQDPEVPGAARSMRASAHQALEEMRGLVTSLRDSSEGGYVGAAPTLHDLGRLIADARDAGVEIAASIDVPTEPGSEVATIVTRAGYRIVQESLTNVLKHAPGSGVSVQVTASPRDGVNLAVVSWFSGAWPSAWQGQGPNQGQGQGPSRGPSAVESNGGGAGIIGMRERAESLGGWLEAGPHENLWVVRAWLPWRSA